MFEKLGRVPIAFGFEESRVETHLDFEHLAAMRIPDSPRCLVSEELIDVGNCSKSCSDTPFARAILSDRPLPDSPQVRRSSEQINCFGPTMSAHDETDVLEPDAFRETVSKLIPEVSAEHLRTGHLIRDKPRLRKKMRTGSGMIKGGAVEAGSPSAATFKPSHHSAHEVAPACSERPEHSLESIVGKKVVAVQEAQVRARCVPDTRVPGCTEPTVLLMHDSDPIVALGNSID